MSATGNTFYLAPGEEFTNCPYSMAHRITNAKELTHVTKCRANYLKECKEKGEKPDMVSCRYVFSHQIPAIEREYHESRCPGSGRYSVASHIAYQGTEEFREKIKQEQPDKLSDVSSDEAPAKKESKKSHKNKTEKASTQVKVKQEPIDDSPPRNHDRFGRDAKRSAKSSRSRSPSRDRSRSRDRRRRSRDRDRKNDRDRSRGSREKKSHRDRSRDRRRSRSRSRDRVRRSSYSRRSSSSPEYERVSKKQKYNSSKKKAPTPPLLTTADLGDENWDEDCKEGYEPGYDPKVKLEADCILYNPMGLKKSERKKFRLENRKKAKIEVEEVPAVEPSQNHEPPNSSIDIKPQINNSYKPAPTYPVEEEEAHYPGPAPGPRYRPPYPYHGYGPGPGFPPHGYGPPPPHMMSGYGPPHPHPHMGPGPGFYGPPPMGMGPPGYGPHPIMYGRPPMGPHPHYGPPPGMYPHYGRPPMVPPHYDPHPPMRPSYEMDRVERGYSPPSPRRYSPPSPRRYSPPSPRRYSPPSPQRDVKPNIKDKDISSLQLPEVTAPALVKRDPAEPFEEGEIDDEGAKNDVKPSQTDDYDWNDDDD